jgi:hypothetical protein
MFLPPQDLLNAFAQQPQNAQAQPSASPDIASQFMYGPPLGTSQPSQGPSPLVAPQPFQQGAAHPVQQAELDQQNQAAHQRAIGMGYIPVGNGTYIHQNDLSPAMLQHYLTQYQQQAAQIYPSNAVFGNSSFATSHPKAASIISDLLIAGTQARAGMNVGDSIGVASRMALAPSQYAQDIAQERAKYVAGQMGSFVNQQKGLADIDEMNSRSKYYDAQTDYENTWKGQLAQNKIETDKATAQQKAQNEADKVANWYAARQQSLAQFTQRDATQRYLAQFRASHPAAQVNQAAITLRSFQSHMDMLDQAEAKDTSKPNPFTGMPLSQEEKSAIHENYEMARQNERDNFGYMHEQQQDAMSAPASTGSTPKSPRTPRAIKAPKGAIGQMKGSDGKQHYVDAQHNDLGVAN